MTKMMATHFTEVRNTSKLDSRTSANVKEYESELREIKSEKETLEIFSKKKSEQANERSESEYDSEHEEEDEYGSDR